MGQTEIINKTIKRCIIILCVVAFICGYCYFRAYPKKFYSIGILHNGIYYTVNNNLIWYFEPKTHMRPILRTIGCAADFSIEDDRLIYYKKNKRYEINLEAGITVSGDNSAVINNDELRSLFGEKTQNVYSPVILTNYNDELIVSLIEFPQKHCPIYIIAGNAAPQQIIYDAPSLRGCIYDGKWLYLIYYNGEIEVYELIHKDETIESCYICDVV